MSYAPNMFSTKGGLSRTIVLGWVAQNDLATIEQWLTQGEPHPRLASEAIVAALSSGKVALAERVWAAGWHKPSQTLKETLMSTTPPGGEGFTLEPGKAHRLAIFPCGLRFPGPA